MLWIRLSRMKNSSACSKGLPEIRRTCQQYKQRTRTRLFLLLLRDGKRRNTILYTFDEDYKVDGKAGNILQYNIGTTTHWTEAPSIAFNNAATGGYQANMNSTILPDGRGGWWISQYRAADEAAVPSLIHY